MGHVIIQKLIELSSPWCLPHFTAPDVDELKFWQWNLSAITFRKTAVKDGIGVYGRVK